MVNISSSLSVLALSFIVVQAVPIQNEMENMIHAQSYSELKHDTFVPMQRLGQDHLPVRKYEQGHKEVSAAEMPFRPIMVVPLPASVTEQQQQGQGQRVSASASINNNGKMMDSKMNNDDAMMQVPTNNNINKNIYDNKVVGMDDQGKIQTVQLPATIHMPMASASASSLPISASTSPSSVAPMAKVSIPMMAPSASSVMMKNRQNLVGMDDMGKLETLVIPMTTNADAAPTQF